MKLKKILNYMDTHKLQSVIIVIILGMLLCSIIAIIMEEHRIKTKLDSINLNLSDDYTYFDNTMEDFAFVLVNDLKNNNINVVSELEYSGNNWSDKYRYDIKLANGDYIYLSGKKENSFEKIIYHGNIEYIDRATLFMQTVARLYDRRFDNQLIVDDINNSFLSSENLLKVKGDSYVYSHLKFDWARPLSNEYYEMIFSVVPEENQEQYLLKIQEEKRLEEEKKIKEEEERKQKEQEEQQQREQEEKERLEQLKQNERTFGAGVYEVGIDIPAGKYNIIAISGRGNCYIPLKVNESFVVGGDKYAIDRYNNATLSNGNKIEISGTIKLKFEPTI